MSSGIIKYNINIFGALSELDNMIGSINKNSISLNGDNLETLDAAMKFKNQHDLISDLLTNYKNLLQKDAKEIRESFETINDEDERISRINYDVLS